MSQAVQSGVCARICGAIGRSTAVRSTLETMAIARAITQMEYAMRREPLGVFNQWE